MVPCLLTIAYVARFGVDVPYWDQWDWSVPIALKTAQHALGFGDLVSQYNEHRVLFTNATTVLFTLTTSWNIKAELFVSVVLASLAVGLLTRMFARDAGGSNAYLIAPIFAALVFSLRQDENWLRSSHNCWYFLVVFLLAALNAVQAGNRPWNLACAAVLALCATLSLLNGILTWPIVLLALMLRGDRRLRDGLFGSRPPPS